MKNPLVNYILKNQVLTAIIVLVIGWLLFQIRGIIVGIFISYIIMAALYPFVVLLQKKGVTRALAVFTVFMTTLLLLLLLIFPLIPFFIEQIQSLIVRFPLYLNQVAPTFGFEINSKQLQTLFNSRLELLGENALSLSAKIFGGVFSAITIIVVSFYFLMEHDGMNRSFVKLFPKDMHHEIEEFLLKVELKLGSWLRGQLVLSFAIGFVTWIALTIAGIPYALPLALLAGLLEIIPTIGPIVAAIPAIIVALSLSPTYAIITAIIYVLIQLLENHVLVPRIMGRAVGLNPLIVLLGIIIGTKLLGIAGGLLSVPFISLVTVIIHAIRTAHTTEK